MEVEDPVEILVGMARRGEIDPWNVDVVDVTDKFLKKLEELKQLDLRISGRVLLYAAILVRMKSEVIVEEEDEGEEEVFDIFIGLDEPFEEVTDVPETFLKTSVRRRVKRHTTLEELVKELKKAEVLEKRRRERQKAGNIRLRKQVSEMMSIPHEEFIEETVEKMERRLKRMLNGGNFITLSQLISSNGLDPVSTFLSLLYLAYRKKVYLRQKQMYGDIEIWWNGNGTAGS
jgi:segregation and condensation protein A